MYKWLGALLLVWFVYTIRQVFPPFIVGGIIAYLLLPVVQYVAQKAKMRLGAATALIYLGGLTIGGILAWFFYPYLSEQFESFISNRREIVNNVLSQISINSGWLFDVDAVTDSFFTSAEASLGKPAQIVHLGGVVSRGLLEVLVTVVSSIYLIVDSKRVGDFVLRLVPAEQRNVALGLFQEMNLMFSRYVRGQLILIFLMSTVAWLFLHYVMHMKYSVPVAILSGFLEIIPVLGPILATTTAAVVGLAQFGAASAGLIILFYTAARWTEDYVIIPKVIGHAVKLHPLVVIFAVLCGEIMAGALGMLIAIPVAASVKVILDFVYPTENG